MYQSSSSDSCWDAGASVSWSLGIPVYLSCGNYFLRNLRSSYVCVPSVKAPSHPHVGVLTG